MRTDRPFWRIGGERVDRDLRKRYLMGCDRPWLIEGLKVLGREVPPAPDAEDDANWVEVHRERLAEALLDAEVEYR